MGGEREWGRVMRERERFYHKQLLCVEIRDHSDV